MRRFAIVLSVLCALLSGWTSAVAQLHDTVAAQSLGEGHGAHHGAGAPCDGGCKHSGKAVHPMLCSACFAVEVPVMMLDRVPLAGRRLPPMAERKLVALDVQPTSPPPKSGRLIRSL